MPDSNATTAKTTSSAGYFETLSSDLVSDVESPRTTFGEKQQHICTWQGYHSNDCKTFLGTNEVTQLYILEDETEINGSHSPFDLLNGIDSFSDARAV